eukprot:scaffold584_cov132-Cylindrotheca_fusiformis.AAC.17
MRWDVVLMNFDGAWEALLHRKKYRRLDTPKISRTLPILKWLGAFTDFLDCVIGARMIPLAYYS